jgi:hypothetical protein
MDNKYKLKYLELRLIGGEHKVDPARVDLRTKLVPILDAIDYSSGMPEVWSKETTKGYLVSKGFTVGENFSDQESKIGFLTEIDGLPFAVKVMDKDDAEKELMVVRECSEAYVNMVYKSCELSATKTLILFERFTSFDKVCGTEGIGSCYRVVREGLDILKHFYHRGIIHGHPHFGNFAMAGENVILFDYDLVRKYTPDQQKTFEYFTAVLLDLSLFIRVVIHYQKQFEISPDALIQLYYDMNINHFNTPEWIESRTHPTYNPKKIIDSLCSDIKQKIISGGWEGKMR